MLQLAAVSYLAAVLATVVAFGGSAPDLAGSAKAAALVFFSVFVGLLLAGVFRRSVR